MSRIKLPALCGLTSPPQYPSQNLSNLSGLWLLAKFDSAVITSDWNAEGSEGNGKGVGAEDSPLPE